MISVPRLWPGETFVLIASGPSLTLDDVQYVRGKARVIAINASYVLAPWADVVYAADAKVWKWYWKKGPRGFEYLPMGKCSGIKYSLTRNDLDGIRVLRRGPTDGLSFDPKVLSGGQNSGYQAINLAVHLGASRILLLGYDMRTGSHGEEHWHPDHPNHSRSDYARYRAYFHTMVKPLADLGVEVVNCTRLSSLTAFPTASLREALPGVNGAPLEEMSVGEEIAL